MGISLRRRSRLGSCHRNGRVIEVIDADMPTMTVGDGDGSFKHAPKPYYENDSGDDGFQIFERVADIRERGANILERMKQVDVRNP